MLQPRTVTIRAIAVLAGGLALLATAAPASAATTPDRPVDRDIDDYVLFATQELSLKGGQQAGRGVISGGNVGVNSAGTYNGNPRLAICSNGSAQLDAGSQIVADTMKLTNDCKVHDVYANSVNGSTTNLHSGPSAFTAPILSSVPPAPAFACNANAPIEVQNNASQTLAPGTYGALKLKDDSVLTLQAGTYTFCDWNQGKDVTVQATNDTIVQIEQTFSSANNATVAPGACRMQWWVLARGPLNSNKTSVSFGHLSEVWGRWWNLNGQTNLGHAANLHGNFWAETMESDWNTNVTGCTPQTTTTTTTIPATTTTTTVVQQTTTTTTVPGGSTTTTTVRDGSTTTTTVPDGSTTTTVPDGSTTTTVSDDDTTTTTLVLSEEAFEDSESEDESFGGGSLPFTGGGSLPIAGAGLLALGTGAAILLRRRSLSRR